MDVNDSRQKNFIEQARRKILKILADHGIVLLDTKEIDNTVQEIGKMYHEMKEEEDIL